MRPRWIRRATHLLALLLCAAAALRADTLTFTNGDELTGRLVRADHAGIVFRSNMANDVSVPWNHIQELRTSGTFVVVDSSGAPHSGHLLISGGMVEVSAPSAPMPQFVPEAHLRLIVDPVTYRKAITARPGPWQGWKGQASGGFSQISATQSSNSYDAQVDLRRPVPSLPWLPQKSATLFHLNTFYGKLSQFGKPTVVTSIYSTALEQDEYVSKRLFLFGNGELDHNYSQGLQLQQAYGGGLGWKLLSSSTTQLSLRADLHYTRQRFLSTAVLGFLASSMTESLRQNYGRIVWTENVSLTPSLTNGLAYQMSGLSAWAVPVYKRFSVNFTVIDSFLNNPQPGFLRNSLQYSTGLQYTLP
jgi:hypothetical protein